MKHFNWGKLFCSRDYIADALLKTADQTGARLETVKNENAFKQWHVHSPDGAMIRVRVDLITEAQGDVNG